MERKLATVLFVDLVDSTRLVTGSDPEVVRRRMREFFDRVSHCVAIHGGIVEKFAGDSVLAVFGIPQAHEDDAERAAMAALAMRGAVQELELEARIGIEAGELVVDEADSSFATGEAINVAARLQQLAKPGEIFIGPTAYRLTMDRIVVEDAGPLELKGIDGAVRVWRVLEASAGPRRQVSVRAPIVGRQAELELLAHTFARTLRDRRAHVFTIFGEPGVGKSRLAREFVDSLEAASVLSGRCLPYGEGITYWSLAEMIKAAAGISDDDPLEEAFDKLRACCEDEIVADLLGLAAGLLEALEGERSPEEISWAAREVMEKLADVQPLVLLFEDIHWAEEPLLDLIEHLADGVRRPLLILCLARPELLDVRPAWGGGRVRSTAIELEALSKEESGELVDALIADLEEPPHVPGDLFERAEGNPLFVEEIIRMLAESGNGGAAGRIPDSLQALIAARIDQLPQQEKVLLQRAAVIGRVFWRGALTHLAPDVEDLEAKLDDLLLREFVLREPRSSISGESAFRFKHVLIREVAYGGLSKLARAQHHGRFGEWLKQRAGEELLEIRAYHLDQAALFLTELDGAPPPELAVEAAAALTAAGKRALAREAFKSARKLLVRAVELEPTLARRYSAARAAWRLGDLAAASVEMEQVRAEADEVGDVLTEALALTALADVALREGDAARARELADRALELQRDETDPDARFDALTVRATVGGYRGDMGEALRYAKEALAVGRAAGRKDLETIAAQALAQTHIIRLELDGAERLLDEALQLAELSGSIRARFSAKLSLAWLYQAKGDLDAAGAAYDEARALAAETGHATGVAIVLLRTATLAREAGDLRQAEKLTREAGRLLSSAGQTTNLADAHAFLGCVLAEQGKVDEAERWVLEAQNEVDPEDPSARFTIALALGVVRAAQGRDGEAEALHREALEITEQIGFKIHEVEALKMLAQFLRERGREDEATALEERRLALLPSTAEIA